MAFVKGKSGNPGGRPKSADGFRRAARGHTLEALMVLREIMLDSSGVAKDRIQAAELIISRAYGKPVDEHTPIDMKALTDEQLEKIIKTGKL